MTVCAWCGARAPGGAATYARAVCPDCLRDLLEYYAEGRAEALRRDETAARASRSVAVLKWKGARADLLVGVEM